MAENSSNNRNEIRDQDLIHEEYRQNPYPFWFWTFLVTAVFALMWGGKEWYSREIKGAVEASPFLQVTNRQMSLFLWQFSDHMRAHVSQKSGYLPGFQYMGNVGPEPEIADQFVAAPPELLFLYHTWDRLLSSEFFPRPIPLTEFKEFLVQEQEWLPQYWRGATLGYDTLAAAVTTEKRVVVFDNLQLLSLENLPLVVRKAFQGWKNYFKEGELINQMRPTYGQMKDFLAGHPQYQRNYWENLLVDTYPDYLKTLTAGAYDQNDLIPSQELAPFLKVAFFNYQKSLEPQHPNGIGVF